jgi:hypothetical protein
MLKKSIEKNLEKLLELTCQTHDSDHEIQIIP